MSVSSRLIPASLFSRALLTLVFTFGLFALLTFSSIVYYALAPVADRSTQDLAGFMVLSTRTLVQLPPELRTGYRQKLDQEYDLRLVEGLEPPPNLKPFFFPYVQRLQEALEERLGHPVEILSNLIGGERWFWVNLEADDRKIWVGFPRDRIHTRPLEGVLVVVIIAAILVVLTAALLARRVTAPLERLSKAAEQVAKGGSPRPLPETGPRELASLARQFNETSRQVRELLANRTFLLAGISHDLRTPLTRIRLALEMLPAETEPALLERMERDLDEMNALITQAVELGKTLGAGERHAVDVAQLIGDLVAGRPRVAWQSSWPCPHRVNALALRRILGNLLENALRYSADKVEMHLDCTHRPPVIFVLDRGPGIPEEEREAVFRPFYRLEHSRSRRTGGSGLGLAVARQLAVANDIEIHLGARNGGGTVASVRLPPASEHDRDKPEAESG
ncbi:MAG: ATP-binding protein [Pseudomonadota bacterium]|nr:ATP-binding protein [Pseudomonadota bacterium]